MKNTELTKRNLERIQGLIADVENMSIEEYKKLLDSMARFYKYSKGNQFLLHLVGASQVAGFKKWQDMGRKVKKGSKAIWILAPILKTYYYNKDNEQVEYAEWKKLKKQGLEVKKKKVKKPIGFKSVPVFDISQTEGEEIKKNFTTKSNLTLTKVQKVAEKLGYTVERRPLEIACGGHIEKGCKITLNNNLDQVENTGTLLHEIAHGELGHLDEKDLKSTSFKELEAETVTAIVCKNLGIDRKSEFYLKSWSLEKDKVKINQDLERIAKISTAIIQAFN